MRSELGELYVLWDVHGCPVPEGLQPEDVVRNINGFCGAAGPVKNFSCSDDILPRRLKDNNVNVLTRGDKNNADVKAMLVDMLVFALDHSAPAMIMLMSGAEGFSPALHTLASRGYTIILFVPDKVYVPESLLTAGNFIGDWPSLATGKGLLPPILPKNNPPDRGIYHTDSDSDLIDHDSDDDSDDDSDYYDDDDEHEDYNDEDDDSDYDDYNFEHEEDNEHEDDDDDDNDDDEQEGEHEQEGEQEQEGEHGDDNGDYNDSDDSYGIQLNLENFKIDLEELIVCYTGFICLNDLEYAYKLRYKKPIKYRALGATGMDDLMNKVSDVIDMPQYPTERFIVLKGTRVLD